MPVDFSPPSDDKFILEQDGAFTPRFDQNGLITVVVTDIVDNDVVMLAHMNAQAVMLTIETGIAHYYSRSRACLWKKGETSGNLQQVQEMRTDCDQDAILLKVKMMGHGMACHTARKSCFYRKVEGLGTKDLSLKTG